MLLVGLLIKDSNYRKKLCEILMVKGEKSFHLYSFSDRDHLLAFSCDSKLDVLLIEEEEFLQMKEIDSITRHYILLTDASFEEERKEDDPSGPVRLSKYSTAGNMIQAVNALYQNRNTDECKVIGIASAVHSCGKTSLAYQLCEQLQEKGDSLLMVLDYRNPIFASKECGLSMIMYELCKSKDDSVFSSLEGDGFPFTMFPQLLKENVKKFDEVTYIPSCGYKEEMEMVQDSHMKALIAYLRESKLYRYIIIDFNDQLLYGESVTSCDMVISPTKKDCFSEGYAKAYLGYIKHTDVREIDLPYVAPMSSVPEYYRELQWSALGGVTKQLIGKLNL